MALPLSIITVALDFNVRWEAGAGRGGGAGLLTNTQSTQGIFNTQVGFLPPSIQSKVLWWTFAMCLGMG